MKLKLGVDVFLWHIYMQQETKTGSMFQCILMAYLYETETKTTYL